MTLLPTSVLHVLSVSQINKMVGEFGDVLRFWENISRLIKYLGLSVCWRDVWLRIALSAHRAHSVPSVPRQFVTNNKKIQSKGQTKSIVTVIMFRSFALIFNYCLTLSCSHSWVARRDVNEAECVSGKIVLPLYTENNNETKISYVPKNRIF